MKRDHEGGRDSPPPKKLGKIMKEQKSQEVINQEGSHQEMENQEGGN